LSKKQKDRLHGQEGGRMGEKRESVITALQDIKKALEADGPVDSFISEWKKSQFVSPDVEDAYKFVRTVYAELIGEAISLLNSST
jgi:hypothetical protein